MVEVRWTEQAADDLESITDFIAHDIPVRISKSRIKRLRNVEHPQYRLRLQDFRVFYDVEDQDVVVLAIVPKEDADDWLNEFGGRKP